MAVRESNDASIIMPQMWPAPVWVPGRSDTSRTRIVFGRVVHNPGSRFFRRLYRHTFLRIFGIYRSSAAVGHQHRGRRIPDDGIALGTPHFCIPYVWPVAPAQGEIHRIIRDRPIPLIARIVRHQFLEFLRLRRANQQIRRLLVRLEKIKPGPPNHVVAPHLERKRKTAVVVRHIKVLRNRHLTQAVHARRGFPLLFRLGQRWQKQRCENCNNGDNHEKFDQGKSLLSLQNTQVRSFHKIWLSAALLPFPEKPQYRTHSVMQSWWAELSAMMRFPLLSEGEGWWQCRDALT